MTILIQDALLVALQQGRDAEINKVNPANVASQWVDTWNVAGLPAAGTIPSAPGAVPTKATTGAMTFAAPGSGKRWLIGIAVCTMPVAMTVMLYDRLVHVGNLVFNITSTQTINSVSVNRPDTTGEGVQIWVVNSSGSSIGGSSAALTVSYTNSDGVAGRTTDVMAPGTVWLSRMGVRMNLQAGDVGVRSVESLTFSVAGGTAGSLSVVLLRSIEKYTSNYAGHANKYDAFDTGLSAIDNNACLVLMALSPTATTSAQIGQVEFRLIEDTV